MKDEEALEQAWRECAAEAGYTEEDRDPFIRGFKAGVKQCENERSGLRKLLDETEDYAKKLRGEIK